MKKATQPNGISLTPGKLLEGDAKLARQVGDAVLVEPRPAAHIGASGGLVAARAFQVDGPDPEQRPIDPVGKRLLVDVKGDQSHPSEPVRTSHDQRHVRHHAETVPPRSSSSSSLVTITGGVPGGVIDLFEPAKVSSASSDATFLLPAGQSRQDRRENAVAHGLPVGTDRRQ